MSNGMGNPGMDPAMEPQVQPQINDVPVSVDAFISRLQQRYSKMVAELMQENAELSAGIQALREARAEGADQVNGLQGALGQAGQIMEQQQARIAELEQHIRDTASSAERAAAGVDA